MEIPTTIQKHKDGLITGSLLFGPVLILIIILFVTGPTPQQDEKPISKKEAFKSFFSNDETAPVHKKFPEVSLEAQSVIVKNLRTGEVLYEKDAYISMPLASITKIMSAVTARNIFKKDQNVQIQLADIAPEGDTALIVGEHWKLSKLLDFTLVGSSNDGAAAVANSAKRFLKKTEQTDSDENPFIAEMNALAEKLGMEKSYFRNESGLDTSAGVGGKGSANDIAILYEYTLRHHPDLFEATTADSFSVNTIDGNYHTISNTNEIVNQLPNLIGSKTGFTDLAGGNLAVVIDPSLNDPIAIVVLGSSRDGRFTDVKKLSNAVLDYLSEE